MCLHSESGTFTPLRAPTRHYQRGISGLVWRLEDLEVAHEMCEKLTVKMWCVSSQIPESDYFSRDESKLIGIVDDRCAMLTISETILERGLVVRGRCHRRRFSDEWGAKILDRLGGFSTMSQPASTMTYSSSCRVVHCHLFKKLELLGEENVPRRIGNKRLVSQQVLSKLELLPSFYFGQLTGLLIFVD